MNVWHRIVGGASCSSLSNDEVKEASSDFKFDKNSPSDLRRERAMQGRGSCSFVMVIGRLPLGLMGLCCTVLSFGD